MTVRAVITVGALVLCCGCGLPSDTPNMVLGDAIVFTDLPTSENGAWCWFQDERAIVDVTDPDNPVLMFTAISASSQKPTERGDLDLHWLKLESSEKGVFELADTLEQDDHNVAALHVLDDGSVLAAYAKHGTDRVVRSRRSVDGNPAEWSPEVRHGEEAGVTYSNLLTAGEDRRVLNFSRSRGWNPNFTVYDAGTNTWRYGGRLLASTGRPYLKYRNTPDGSAIHVVATDQHPRDFDNSIYHGITDGRQLLDSFGNVVDASLQDQEAATPQQLTRVFQGDPDNVAWMADVELDVNGNPVIAFSVQKDGRGLAPRSGGLDHRYHLARLTDQGWIHSEIAFAGTRLYPFEDDYTGLVAIDPHDANHVVISTDADPTTGEPLISLADGQRHYELYEGTSSDGGASFTWSPLTRNSTVDNIRPIIPSWESDRRIVLWMRGTYSSYTDWDTDIVGLVQDR